MAKFPMDPAIRSAWAQALRDYSGFKTTRVMNDGRGLCPLGVLVDLYRASNPGEDWVEENDIFSFLGSSLVLPEAVHRWCGLNVSNPSLAVSDSNYTSTLYMAHLTLLSDGVLLKESGSPYSWSELADLIEAQL